MSIPTQLNVVARTWLTGIRFIEMKSQHYPSSLPIKPIIYQRSIELRAKGHMLF
jgi:hypothetical protein